MEIPSKNYLSLTSSDSLRYALGSSSTLTNLEGKRTRAGLRRHWQALMLCVSQWLSDRRLTEIPFTDRAPCLAATHFPYLKPNCVHLGRMVTEEAKRVDAS